MRADFDPARLRRRELELEAEDRMATQAEMAAMSELTQATDEELEVEQYVRERNQKAKLFCRELRRLFTFCPAMVRALIVTKETYKLLLEDMELMDDHLGIDQRVTDGQMVFRREVTILSDAAVRVVEASVEGVTAGSILLGGGGPILVGAGIPLPTFLELPRPWWCRREGARSENPGA